LQRKKSVGPRVVAANACKLRFARRGDIRYFAFLTLYLRTPS